MDITIDNELMELSIEWGKYSGNLMLDLFFSIGIWMLIVGFLGFITAIVCVLILHRKGWLKRDKRYWNLVTKISYPAVFISLTITGLVIGGIYGGQKNINSRITDELVPALQKNMPTLHEYIVSEVENSEVGEKNSEDIVKGILATLYFQPDSENFISRMQARCINWFTLNFGKWLITAGVTGILAYGIGRTGDDLGITKDSIAFTMDLVKKMDFSKVDNTICQIVANAFQQKIDEFFRGFYLNVLLIQLVILLIIAGECFVYWYLKKKQPN